MPSRKAQSRAIVLASNVDDEVAVDRVALPKPDDELTIGDLTVTRQDLQFTVSSKDGSPVIGLEPYVGQPAHLIAVRQGDLAYTHLHPADAAAGPTFSFHGSLPTGTYRLFLQFGYRGDIADVPLHGGSAMSPATTAEHVDLSLEGMTCAACATRIETKLNRLDGVTATRELRDGEGVRRVRSGGGVDRRPAGRGRVDRVPGKCRLRRNGNG